MWSFNHDGGADERLRHNLEQQMGIDEADKRAQRRAFTELAHAQHGVDAMADQFDGTTPLPGVVDVHPPSRRGSRKDATSACPTSCGSGRRSVWPPLPWIVS